MDSTTGPNISIPTSDPPLPTSSNDSSPGELCPVTSPTSLAIRDSMLEQSQTPTSQPLSTSIANNQSIIARWTSSQQPNDTSSKPVTSNLSSRFSSRTFFSANRRSASELDSFHEMNDTNDTKETVSIVSRDTSTIQSRQRTRPSSKRSIFRDTVSFLARDSTPFVIPENAAITCEGYLTKRGHVVTNWKTRYFVLKGDILLYYNDESAARNTKEKPLGQVKVEKVSTWSGETNGFMFYTGKQIPYYVYAASEFECNKWIKAMKDFIVQQDPVDCEGYLTKRGHLVPSYRLRYFVLRGISLKYYTDKDTFLANQNALAEMEISSVAKWNGERTGIVFRTTTGNLLYLYADTVQEQNKWLQCLSSVKRKSVTFTSSGTTSGNALLPAESITWSGYLKKQGHKRKSWKKRYFVLRVDRLSYYTDQESAMTKGIPIAEIGIQDVQLWESGGPYGMMITTTEQVPYYFLAENERDRMQWISHLRSASNRNSVEGSGLPEEQKKFCPRCEAVLTGSKFCGACGHKMRNATVDSDESMSTTETAQVLQEKESGANENTNENDTPFDELEALSEGARTLLLAVMQTPEGVNIGDTNGAFPPRLSARKLEKRLTGTDFAGSLDEETKATTAALLDETGVKGVNATEMKAEEKQQRTGLKQSNTFDDRIMDGEMETKTPILRASKSLQNQVSKSNDDSPIASNKPPLPKRRSSLEKKNVIEQTRPKQSEEAVQQLTHIADVRSSSEPTSNAEKVEEEKKIGSRRNSGQPIITKTDNKSTDEIEEDDGSFYDTVTLDTRGIAVLSQQESAVTAEPKSKPEQIAAPPVSNKNDLYTFFEKELDFSPLYVPSADSPVRCRIYGSMNYASAAAIVLFLSDSGPLGLWKLGQQDQSNAATIDNANSMLPYLSRAQEEGYGILLSNPYTNSVTVYEEGGLERVVAIPKSSTAFEHADFLWENMLLPCKGKISIIAYGNGGALAKYLLEKNEAVAKNRIHRIGFIESLHSIDGNESPGFLELIGRRAIHWESSAMEVVGGQIVESQQRYGCVCLSSGDANRTLEKGKKTDVFINTEESIFAFLKANPERPGMTAIVGYIRGRLRRRKTTTPTNRKSEKPPTSGVLVLGETNDDDEDSMTTDETSENADETGKQPYVGEGEKNQPQQYINNGQKSPYYLPRHGSVKSPPKSAVAISVKDFELLKIVGQGGFGKVYLAKKLTEPNANQYFAMKVLKKKHVLASGLVNTTMAERHILTEISHPFIVKLHYAFQSENKLFLVMDYLPGGSLALHLRRKRKFSEDYALFYAAEIASAMAHLHYVNIVYRDAKLENVLMDHEGHVRVTDFGLSKVGVSGLQGATTFCGTAAYIAPELLQGNSYGKAADWWSFGILLYEMIGGKPPYYHRNRDIMFQTILKQEWVTFSPSFSDSAVSLIRGLLTRDPTKRLGSGSRGADEILTHPFFKSINWADLLEKKISPPFSPGVGEYDTYYAPRHLLNNEITPKDREASMIINKPNQKNDFDGFSFVGRAPISGAK